MEPNPWRPCSRSQGDLEFGSFCFELTTIRFRNHPATVTQNDVEISYCVSYEVSLTAAD